MKISIRKAQRADAGELTRIAHAAKRYWGYPRELLAIWDRVLTVTPDAIARRPVYCAVRGRQTVGFYAISGTQRVRERVQ